MRGNLRRRHGTDSSGRATVRSLLAVCTAVSLASVAACAPGTGGTGDDKGKITVWSWRTEDIAGYNKIFAVYERKHPGVQVEFKAFKNTEYPTILQTGLAKSEGGPDVVQLKPYGPIQAFIASGSLVPLDGKVDLSGFAPELVDCAKGKQDGKIYGVPFALQTLHVLYNKKIFADQGLQPPKTWNELISTADKLKKAGITPFATTGKEPWVLALLHEIFGATRYGGNDFAKALLSGEKKFTDPDYVASLDVVRQLKPHLPENVTGVAYTDAQTLFTSGKAAMYPGGAFELGPFKSAAPDLDIGFFNAPPAPSAKIDHPVTPGFADGSYGVNAKSKRQNDAIELVKWMATPEFGQLFTNELKQISAVPGVSPDDPLLAEMARNYSEHGTPYTMLVYFGYGQPLGRDAVGQALSALLLGQETAKSAAERIQKEISQWFEPTQ